MISINDEQNFTLELSVAFLFACVCVCLLCLIQTFGRVSFYMSMLALTANT